MNTSGASSLVGPVPATPLEGVRRAAARVQAVERPGGAVLSEVRAFLAACAVEPTRVGCVSPDHDPRWLAVLDESLRHRPYALIARGAAGEVRGYLPLALVAGRLFGRFLVSLPYLNRAGVVADAEATAAALIDRAVELAAALDVRYLELRHDEAIEHPALHARRDEKVRMVLDLPSDADALWKGLDAKVRNQVRKGDKSGLSVKWGGHELLDDFYTIFAANMRDLGTPVYSRRLFERVLTHLNDSAELAVTYCDTRPVAGALLVHAASTTAVPSASSLRAFAHTNANMWMYHRLLLRAMERGCRRFDFGRSSADSGTYRFKKQWGAAAYPTVWQYHVRRGDINAVRPDSPKYRRRIETWQKLPVWLTRLVGPPIVRGIP